MNYRSMLKVTRSLKICQHSMSDFYTHHIILNLIWYLGSKVKVANINIFYNKYDC